MEGRGGGKGSGGKGRREGEWREGEEGRGGGKGRVKQCLGCLQCEGVTLPYLLGWLYG